MKELTFNVNNFNESDIKEGNMAKALLIRNIIIMRPGTYPSAPGMGFNISKYDFEFIDDEIIDTMENELSSQIETYLPSMADTEVEIVKNTNSNGLTIGVQSGGSIYSYSVTEESGNLLVDLIV